MPFPDAIHRETAATPRWLSIIGIGEDGIEGLSAAARGLIGAAEIVFGGRRHLSLAAPLIRGAARPWPSPFDGAADEVMTLSRPPGLRARLGRSVSLRRWRGAGAKDRRARDDRGAGALGVQPGGGEAWLVAAANHSALGARPHARSGAPASATRRPHTRVDLGRRRAGSDGAASRRNRASAAPGSRCSKPSAGLASACGRRRRRPSILARSNRSTRWRSRWRLRPARASSREARD